MHTSGTRKFSFRFSLLTALPACAICSRLYLRSNSGARKSQPGRPWGRTYSRPASSLTGRTPSKPCTIAVSNADEGRKAVLQVKEMGADFVKVYSMLPRDAFFAIADEAKRQHMVF